MGMAPPITSKHYGTYNQRLRDATDLVREANKSAVASCLRKDAAPDEVIDVMALGLSEATQLSLEWWSWLPGRPDRCWMWRCSASAATSARRRSVLTPHRLSFWSGGRGFLGDRTGAGCGGAQQVLQPVPGEGVS